MAPKNGKASRKRGHESSGSAKPSTTKNKNNSRHPNKKKARSWKNALQKTLSISSSTLNAVRILMLAIIMGMAWNAWDGVRLSSDDLRIRSFLDRVCLESPAYCHPSLVPRRRTQMAVRNIVQGERILELPRSLQIWDLDALRNDWIRQHLKDSQHRRTGNPVDRAAYLALYLALVANGRLAHNAESKEDAEILQSYLNECMPSLDDLDSFHPILWNDTELVEQILPHSATFTVTKVYRDMVKSEYQAFTDACKDRTNDNLRDFLTEQTYTRFRILVLSRSFGTGPLPKDSLSTDELQRYSKDFGIDLSRGCYAMVPILDFYDHHGRPNVQYAYDADKEVFVVQATQLGILAGQEIVDSYGKYTDAHLFAKFGFVNGDGSGYSQLSLATQHRLYDVDLKQQFSYLPIRGTSSLDSVLRKALNKQKEGVRQYLRFDDGYEECIPMTESDESKNDAFVQQARELKKLKWQHLTRIANHAKRWHLVLVPRAPESLPARASNEPITYEPPKMTQRNAQVFQRKEYQLVAATCRLISLTHEDYDGKAIELLQDNLHSNSFLLESQVNEYSDRDSLAAALEFRTHFCLARLASEAFQRFPTSMRDMEDRVAHLNRHAFQTNEWTAAHLQLSEMQALETLRRVSFSAAREYEDLRNKYPPFTIRDSACPDTWD